MNNPAKSASIVVVVATLLINAGFTNRCEAHGMPITVSVVSDAITIAGGTPDPLGFSSMIFVDGSEDSVMSHVTLPGFGPVALTLLPGFHISGIEVDSGLFLNIIRRPVNNAAPDDERMLWFATASSVTAPPNGDSLVIADEFGQITVPRSGPLPAPLKIANPNADEINEHIHPLRYLLDNSPAAAIGAYGFFAYLTTTMAVTPSEPLLVILNNGIDDPDELLAAAKRINAAAFLPGDYNHDDRVDSADYIIWRQSLNATGILPADGSGNGIIDLADYEVWRTNFGRSYPAAASAGTSERAAVPEPTTLAPLLVYLTSVFVARCRKYAPR